MAQSQERRKWPRLEVAFKILLKPLEVAKENSAEDYHYTKNISTGGLLFESDEATPVAQGSVFDVEISMPLAKYGFTSSRRLEARGKVCRVESSPAEGRRAVALEFMAPPRFITA